ncbi:MAG: YceI family protein [Bacteroidetes bacterium]|nr:YceI family protein [Bacteroidota bacterium]
MRNLILATPLLALALMTMSFAPMQPATSYKVNTNQSKLFWKAKKVTGSHEGTVNIKSGNLEVENGQLKGGYFEIDMTSILVTDLSGDMKGSLEGHLKSEDFFGTEKYPTALLRITSVASRGVPGEYKVTANATIKGKTKEIRFTAKMDEAAGVATADIELDRTDFDIRYGSGSFFDNLGDKTIYDEFTISVKLNLVKA